MEINNVSYQDKTVTMQMITYSMSSSLMVDFVFFTENFLISLLLATGSLLPHHHVPLKSCRTNETDSAGKYPDSSPHEERDFDNQGDGYYYDDEMYEEDGEGDYEDVCDGNSDEDGDGDDDDDDGFLEDDEEEEEELYEDNEEDDEDESMGASSDDTTESEEDMDDTLTSLLRHAREVYSSSSFRLFKHEHKKSLTLDIDVINEDADDRGLVFEYELQKTGHHFMPHKVTALPFDGIVNCSCNYFEISGILCCHAQTVLRCLRIEKIPEHYLSKMTKNESGVSVVEPCCLEENHKQLQSSSPCSHNSNDVVNGSEDDKAGDADLVDSPLLRHASDVYISEIVDIFHEEYKKSEYLFARLLHETYDHRGIVAEFEVRKPRRSSNHKVHAESANGIVRCSCKKFEYDGVLCSHALCVLDRLCIVKIPAQYILERFTKDGKVCSVKCIHGPEYSNLESFARYKSMRTSFDVLLKMAAKSDRALSLVERGIEELNAQITGKLKEHAPTELGEASLIAQEREKCTSATQEVEIKPMDKLQRTTSKWN